MCLGELPASTEGAGGCGCSPRLVQPGDAPRWSERNGRQDIQEVNEGRTETRRCDPSPPGAGKDSRWVDIYEDGLDEEQLATWIRQAAALPGWDLT